MDFQYSGTFSTEAPWQAEGEAAADARSPRDGYVKQPTQYRSEKLDEARFEAGLATTAMEEEVRRARTAICARIDQRFVWLMPIQWAAAIGLALWIAPFAWAGDTRYLHPHVTLATLYGGVLTLTAILLTRIAPGERVTRLTIGALQMLMSSLLIHLSGGRIETHFHIFGSLAFLALYMDWQVLAVASVTLAIDHALRGIFLPYSIFGTYLVEPWRWVEHDGWVAFMDFFLILACNDRLQALRSLTEERSDRERLLHNALHDSLTGLPNRTFLSDKIAEAIRAFPESQRRPDAANSSGIFSQSGEDGFSCLYIDLDRFKDINDQLGHVAGDRLMQLATARIREELGSDCFLARVSSDEFVALVPQCKAEPRRAEETARTILRSLLPPFEMESTHVGLSASIGISCFPQDGLEESELLMKSDRAMYQVKRAGRNDYLFFDTAMTTLSSQREEAERRLIRAIEKQEFRLHYQPIFHAKAGIAGFEALIRWNDPARGAIPPSSFIPLAEETGLVVQLGSFVLHEACKQASDWYSRGLLQGSIAVNVSSIELAREDYADSVKLTLSQHYTPPQCIELEVTESALVNDFILAERHLRELREYGIRISIDDFGTGYSSLGRLRQLTLDTLKIDRLFIDGVETSDADKTVVEHIIGMAHTLGMQVIAEGVETEGQLAVLRTLRCDLIQGFYLSRPLKMEDAEAQLLHIVRSYVES